MSAMRVDKKKPLRLCNTTKYFIPNKDKVHNVVSSPESYQSRDIKIQGYETRLYWQYRYCEAVGGATFYYTLTYNDNSIPVKYGQNCFDYEDLRELFTGSFRKVLYRKYGTKLKYFVGAELGDGKGSRGLHNNPHYHILFFLEPCPWYYKRKCFVYEKCGVYSRKSKYHKKGDIKYKRVKKVENVLVPYVPISDREFQHLIRLHWQGFDQYDEFTQKDKFVDYKTFTKGIVKEGKYGSRVNSFYACTYVAKYCSKDAHLRSFEINLDKLLRLKIRQSLKESSSFAESFIKQVLFPLYNIPDAKGNWKYDVYQLICNLNKGYVPDYFNTLEYQSEQCLPVSVKWICIHHNLWKQYVEFLNKRVEDELKLKVNEWRNRYSNKCRISQGVGDYALDFVEDLMNPTFEVPDGKDGFKKRPISLYYYRKMFTGICKPIERTFNGKFYEDKPVRVLNQLGIEYKVNKLKSQIEKKAELAKSAVLHLNNNKELFERIKASDCNVDVFYTYEHFKRRLDDCLINNIDIYEKYGMYKLVYEGRFFEVDPFRSDSDFAFHKLNYVEDYTRFLLPSVFSVSRSDLRFDSFIKNDNDNYLSYDAHPDFLCYVGLFHLFDLYADYFFVQKDNERQKKAEEFAEIRRFHKSREMNEYVKTHYI